MMGTIESIHVLHIEDDPEFADLVATFIESRDGPITIRTAESADEGLALLNDRTDCVVSDYDLPGMNGLELFETVRTTSPNLPFILFTSKNPEAVASDAMSAGVTDYVQKCPVTVQTELLQNRIKNAVMRRRAQTAYQELSKQCRSD